MEILSLDLEEQQQHLGKILLLGIASAVCLSFGLLLLTFFVVVIFGTRTGCWFWAVSHCVSGHRPEHDVDDAQQS